jgi:hypothetical protein
LKYLSILEILNTIVAETIQALADVFSAAETKTILVRSRYKYVRTLNTYYLITMLLKVLLQRIVNAINTKHVKLNNEWDQALSYASGELKRRADPFRTVDLSGYLKVAPYVGGVSYLGALFVQQAIPELFIFAYPLAAFSIILPIVFIVLTT